MIMFLAALLAAEAASAAVPPASAAAKVQAPAKPAIAAAPKPSRAQVLAAVKAEWAQHDAGSKGRLTPLEFGTWVMTSHGGKVADKPRGKGIKPVSAMNASATAFARADADHDGGVTPDEMTNFLMLPPTPTALQQAQAAARAARTTKPAPSPTATAKAGTGS